ncbi:unnamed protein product [Bemisia tabaci]|uniref:Uncharacterized protein n=1 Tax=Bemisia tabaci TaxID=7038 RepID=A0A9P0F5E7_BEMTA|nr:unnamed protein product [Bemisia tabaci]
MEGLSETQCKVCGDKASGKHYGVASCDGCRGFFKRSIRRNLEYVCKENGKCIVDVTRRNQCQACRFSKCLLVNMKKDAVQHERTSRQNSHHHHHRFHRSRELCSPIFPSAFIYRYPHPFPYSVAAIMSKSELHQTTPASRPLGAFNNYLALHDCQYISVSKDCQQLLKEDEVSSSEEVQHITPQDVTKSSPISPKKERQDDVSVDMPNEGIYESAAKLLFLAVKWARSIPSFIQLPSHDQSLLLEDSWSELFALSAAQWSFALDQGFLVINSAAPEYRHSALEETVRKLKGIVNRILTMRLDHTEFTCLKALVLFKSDVAGLSEPSYIELLQDQTQVMLREYISVTSKVRFGKLLLLLPVLASLEKRNLEELFFRKTIGNVSISSLLTDMLRQ